MPKKKQTIDVKVIEEPSDIELNATIKLVQGVVKVSKREYQIGLMKLMAKTYKVYESQAAALREAQIREGLGYIMTYYKAGEVYIYDSKEPEEIGFEK